MISSPKGGTAMNEVQVPGTLFVALCALVGWMIGAPEAVLLLALGCAIGWVSVDPGFSGARQWAFFGALLVWFLAFIYLCVKVLL